MPTIFNVAGVTHGALHDGAIPPARYGDIMHVYLEEDPENEHDARAIAVYAVLEAGADQEWAPWAYRIGFVPVNLLDTAHANDWCNCVWTIDAIGTWAPQAPNLPAQDRVVPYCRLSLVAAPTQQ